MLTVFLIGMALGVIVGLMTNTGSDKNKSTPPASAVSTDTQWHNLLCYDGTDKGQVNVYEH